jgi:autoinducer 2 (AI-2) kinase
MRKISNSNNVILTIDISSNRIKTSLISDKLEPISSTSKNLIINNDDVSGFIKSFNMEDLWNKIKACITELSSTKKFKEFNCIGISSCAQRMAVVFVDKLGKELYGGPNIDVRGIDSAYLIDNEFSEEELFNITGHSPSILFCLSRLLWFKEEMEEIYNSIDKILMLDDWIVYKLTGKFYTDLSSASESQILDIKKEKWSNEIINTFDFNPDLFPEIIDTGTIISDLKPELIRQLGFNQKSIPIIKSGGDTQATLLGMGAIDNGNIGISLGTTAPIHLVVDKPYLDPNCNFWTLYHSIKGKWLVEANPGNTGMVFDWLKNGLLKELKGDKNSIIDGYLKRIKPGSESTYAFLGPEFMNIKDQATLKRGVFIFPPITLVTENFPKLENLVKSAVENICFGILQNYNSLKPISDSKITSYCAGGMAKSKEILKILTNILQTTLIVPQHRDSAFTGCAMNVLVGIKSYPNYKTIIENYFNYDDFTIDPSIAKNYEQIYKQWVNLKKKVDFL